MENFSVFNTQQLKEIIYEVVSECFDDKINHSFVVEKPEDEGFYDRDEICELLHITYPTLWRIEKTGILKRQKVGLLTSGEIQSAASDKISHSRVC